ncbi:MAG: hypothetical protein MI717_11425 [Spirochaetales bacterium]|nr:hypothetical protein [Spirochaetales bacterium]
MNRKSVLLFCFLIIPSFLLWAQNTSEVLKEIDQLWLEGEFSQSLELAEQSIAICTNDSDTAELLWRRSRAIHDFVMNEYDKENITKEDALTAYEDAEESATESLRLKPASAWAHYWRSANIGSWGDTKGIIDSISRLPDLKADLHAALAIDPAHGDSWSVLAMIDASIPALFGGSIDRAVSLDRKAVSLWNGEEPFPWEWYSELTAHLYKRDWSNRKRLGSLDKKAQEYEAHVSNIQEKNRYFEGTIDFSQVPLYSTMSLEDMSDREETREVLLWLTGLLERRLNRTPYEEKMRQEFHKRLQEWKLP